MKRIIDGVTYNTDTSTLLAQSEYEATYNHNDFPCVGRLYQTRGGAFFVHEEIDVGFDREAEERVIRDRAQALSEDAARDWLMHGDNQVFHNPFEDPPEAAAEAEPSATIYVRVPASLKQRLEQAAKAEKLSGNSWAIRCIESCLAPDDQIRVDLAKVWWLANSISQNKSAFTSPGVRNIASDIENLIEKNWKPLGLAQGRFDKDISDIAVSEDFTGALKDYQREGE